MVITLKTLKYDLKDKRHEKYESRAVPDNWIYEYHCDIKFEYISRRGELRLLHTKHLHILFHLTIIIIF